MINSNIDPLSYREEFINKGSAVIRDFLDLDYANKLSEFFNGGMPENWWYSVSFPGTKGFVEFIRNFPENEEQILIEKKHANELFNQNYFTYHFYRSAGDHVQGCYCEECNFRTWLHSEEILNFLSTVSGYNITNYNTMFASKYSEGCFLSPHHDESLGRVGFVLQLT